MRSSGLAALCCALLASPALAGEVKIEVRADGTRVLLNEPGESMARRLAGRLVSPPDQEMSRLIEDFALERELDPRLVQAVVQVESGYNPQALSNKGAIGLMQLMPGTARELAVVDPWSPEQNLRGGTSYLRQMLDRFGDLELALAAYNAGPEAVVRHSGIPPYDETRAYVRKILHLMDGSDGGGELEGRRVRITRDANNRIRLTTAGLGG